MASTRRTETRIPSEHIQYHKSQRAVLRVKVWVEVDGTYVFGRGISEILKAIDAERSIKQAAGRLGKSYRYVWRRVKEAEQTLGVTLVETQVGGRDAHRSRLSDTARQLTAEFDSLRARIMRQVEVEFPKRLERLFEA